MFDLRPLICRGLDVQGRAGNSSELWRALGEQNHPGREHDAVADAIGIVKGIKVDCIQPQRTRTSSLCLRERTVVMVLGTLQNWRFRYG